MEHKQGTASKGEEKSFEVALRSALREEELSVELIQDLTPPKDTYTPVNHNIVNP